MSEKKTARFVRHARRLEDLQFIREQLPETSYAVVKTISLSVIDYENFTTDLLADRSFLDGTSAIDEEIAELNCIFIHEEGRQDGILVVPTADHHVKLAAYTDACPD